MQGYTHFEARIDTRDRTRTDVFWMLNLLAIAGGPAWRRVRSWERPSLWLTLSSFTPPLRHWTNLEHFEFLEPGG